jgi:hypothetical protein
MAVGQRTFESRDVVVKKFSSEPFPAGEYDLKLETEAASVGKKDEPGKFPYVNIRWRALGTASQEGGKDRLLFHMLFTSLKPMKNGGLMVENANQIVAMARAMGQEIGDAGIGLKSQKDENGQMQDYLDPQAVLQWVKNNDGVVVKAKVKVTKSKEYGDKNEIDFFEPAEAAASEEESYEEPEQEEEEHDPIPPPRKAAPAPARRK